MFIKTIKDYYEDMYKKFPGVPKKDIRTILNYGWKAIYLHNSYGGDFETMTDNFYCHIGNLYIDGLLHFKYYLEKLKVKARVMYKRNCKEWDGYYYFSLNNKQWEAYLAQKNSKGRPKKYFNFGNVVLYKIYDECRIANWNKKYFFRVKYPVDRGYSLYRPNYRTGDAEFLEERPNCKFENFLTSSPTNNFKYI